MNDVIATKLFRNKYNIKRRTVSNALIMQIKIAMNELRITTNPELLGRPKEGKLAGLYSYDLDLENRLLYRVQKDANITRVYLMRVCNHEQVYPNRRW